MSTDALRLRAEGVTVPTTDGDALLRFSLYSVSLLEEEFGTMGAAWDAFREAAAAAFDGRLATMLGSFLRAGFATPEHTPSRAEALARVDCRYDVAVDLVYEAIEQAFPPATESEGNGKADEGSTGQPSTTPPPSDGTAPTTSSGV